MSEKHADVLDQAAAVTDLLTQKLVEERRALAAPETHPDFDGRHCVEEDCGEPIPDERLSLGKVRCISCQTRRETANRGNAPRWR